MIPRVGWRVPTHTELCPADTSLSPCRERRARRVPRHPRHSSPQGRVCPGDHPGRSPAPQGAALPGPGREPRAAHPQHRPRAPGLAGAQQLPPGERQENVVPSWVGHLGLAGWVWVLTQLLGCPSAPGGIPVLAQGTPGGCDAAQKCPFSNGLLERAFSNQKALQRSPAAASASSALLTSRFPARPAGTVPSGKSLRQLS